MSTLEPFDYTRAKSGHEIETVHVASSLRPLKAVAFINDPIT